MLVTQQSVGKRNAYFFISELYFLHSK